MAESPIVSFCPHCQRYASLAAACTCGWQRPQPVPLPGGCLWQRSLGTKLRRGPALGGGLLFVGGEDGLLRAVSTADGAQRWVQDLRSPIQARPASDGTYAVAGTQAGQVFAFAVQDGALLWPTPFSTGAPGTGAPALAGGVAYVGDALGHLHALSLPGGQPVWPQPFAARKVIGAAPAVARGLVIAGSHDESVYAVDARRGIQVWQQPLGDRIGRAPFVQGRAVFAGTQAGRVVKLDLFSGSIDPRFGFAAGGAIGGELTMSADGSVLYVGSADGRLYAVDAQTGQERRRFEAASPVAAIALQQHGLLFVGCGDGRVLALEADGLKKAWEFPADSAVVGLAQAEGAVSVATQAGSVYALPWHLGQWAWAADWSERRGRLEEAATFHALAGDLACALDERRHHDGAALSVWRASADPERAARLREARLEAPEQVAAEYEQAAQVVYPRDRQRGADLYLRAESWYDEAGREPDARRCRGKASRLVSLPRLEVREFNFPTFELGEKGQLDFDIYNFGDVPAADLWVRMGGELAKSVRFGLDRPVLRRDRVGVEAKDVVPLGSQLRIELQRGEHGPRLGGWVFDLKVIQADATITADGDLGGLILRLSRDAPLPKIRVRGDVGMLKVQVEESLRQGDRKEMGSFGGAEA